MTPEDHAAGVRAWRAERDAAAAQSGRLADAGGPVLAGAGREPFRGRSNEPDLAARRGRPGSRGLDPAARGIPRACRTSRRTCACDGQPAADGPLVDDRSEEPTVLELGDLRMHVICRGGDRLALRVRDHTARALAAFGGIEHFPIDIGWRMSGRLEPDESDEPMEIVDVTGIVTREASPWPRRLRAGRPDWRLRSLDGGDGKLWLVFGDATNGTETYGGGRFLYTEPRGRRRHGGGRLQPGLQPAVRLLPVRHLPAAAGREPAAAANRGGRAHLPRGLALGAQLLQVQAALHAAQRLVADHAPVAQVDHRHPLRVDHRLADRRRARSSPGRAGPRPSRVRARGARWRARALPQLVDQLAVARPLSAPSPSRRASAADRRLPGVELLVLLAAVVAHAEPPDQPRQRQPLPKECHQDHRRRSGTGADRGPESPAAAPARRPARQRPACRPSRRSRRCCGGGDGSRSFSPGTIKRGR